MIIQSEKQAEWQKRVAQRQDLDGPMELPTPRSSGLPVHWRAAEEGVEAEVVCGGNNWRTERPVSTGTVDLGGGGESIPSLSV